MESESDLALAQLKVEHRDLDDVIDYLIETGFPDEMKIQRLKKRKLHLRDQIARLGKDTHQAS